MVSQKKIPFGSWCWRLLALWLGTGLAAAAGSETRTYVEFAFEVPPAAAEKNPFERDLWAEVTVPGAAAREYPAFYDGGRTWRVRVRATARGEYRLGALRERRAAGKAPAGLALDPAAARVQTHAGPLAAPGVGRDPRNPRGFRRDDGAIYYPVGLNLAWGDEAFYRRAFPALAAAGGNWSRLWMAHWGGADLDWLPEEMGRSPAPGTLDLRVAARWDRVLAAAEAAGLYVQVVLQQHGQFSTEVNAAWAAHPWNRANGGFLKKPADFFTAVRALRHTRWKYRYLVARYGHSPAVLAWELFNEVHYTDAWKLDGRAADVVRWHEAMAAWIRANDPHGHLVTTSAEDFDTPLWRTMDYYQPHLYAVNMLAHVRRFPAAPQPFDKPAFYGELGDDHQAFVEAADKASGAGLMPPLWAGLMADGALPAQPWYWDRLLDTPRWDEFVSWAGFTHAARLAERAPGLAVFTPVVTDAGQVPQRLLPGFHWARRAPLTLAIPADGREPAELADVPEYFVPPLSFPVFEGRTDRLMLRFHREQAGPVRFHFKDLGKEGVTLRFELNGAELLRRTWPAEARPDAARLRPGELTLTIPAGPQTLTLRNLGPDSFRLERIELDTTVPALAAVGRKAEGFAMLYVWHRAGVTAAIPPVAVNGRIALGPLRAGRWRVVWWDMAAARPATETLVEHPGGEFSLATPAIARHAAAFLEQLSTP